MADLLAELRAALAKWDENATIGRAARVIAAARACDAELAEALRDARRYRWLRENADLHWGGPIDGRSICQPTTYQSHEIDAAIDTAIGQAKSTNNKETL